MTEHHVTEHHVTNVPITMSLQTPLLAQSTHNEPQECNTHRQMIGQARYSQPQLSPVIHQLYRQNYTAPVVMVTQSHDNYVTTSFNDQMQQNLYYEKPRKYSGPVLVASPGTSQKMSTQEQVLKSPVGRNPSLPHVLHHSALNTPSQQSNAALVAGGYTPPPVLKTRRSTSQPTQNLVMTRQMIPHQNIVTQSLPSGYDSNHCNSNTNKDTEIQRNESLVSVTSKLMNTSIEEEGNLVHHDSSFEDFGGFDYQFLVSPEMLQDLNCPICHLVLREPYLTGCCGTHFCYSCFYPLLLKQAPCPMCNNRAPQGIIDKFTDRRINALYIKCPQWELGCKWEGPLGTLKVHLDPAKGGCEFLLVSCPMECGLTVSLSLLNQHQMNDCPRRICTCKFCHYQGMYGDMPNLHWPVCEGFPVPCPNNCDTNDMPRRDLKDHLLICVKRKVECEFAYAGCDTAFTMDELPTHMNDSVNTHLKLVSEFMKNSLLHRQTLQPVKEFSRSNSEREKEIIILNSKLNEKDKEITKLKTQIEALQEEIDDIHLDVAHLKSTTTFIPPYSVTVHNFSESKLSGKQWFSPPFYSHPCGYKLCMSVDCNGSDEGYETHVSVYANLMQGEFDENLVWPFCGVIQIQLLNQFNDKSPIVHDIPFGRHVPSEISGRVTDQSLAESGLGVPQFIHHQLLTYDRHANTEYLKNDCLKFCVSKITIKK